MFDDAALVSHLKNNHTLALRSVVLAEFNMNQMDKVSMVGNYRYRPLIIEPDTTLLSVDSLPITAPTQPTAYSSLINIFDTEDTGDYYTDATKSTVYLNIGYDDVTPITLSTVDEKMNLYYDLEECTQAFRPRSGINKLFLNREKRSYTDMIRSAERPRYYFASKDDRYKYWSSYRVEDQVTYGISSNYDDGGGYQIQDTAPFVIYEELMPTNKIVVKVQTNVGSYRLSTSDPMYGSINMTTPKRWRIEYLTDKNVWQSAFRFTEDTLRIDGSPVFSWDGVVELKYGFKIPTKYKDNFNFGGYITSIDYAPPLSGVGYLGEAYVVLSATGPGTMYVRSADNEWETFPVEYEFSLLESGDYGERSSLKAITDPSFYLVGIEKKYREFVMLKGLRIVVETMNTPNTPFELIEISPRLLVDLTDHTLSFSFGKNMITGEQIPVGDLFASNGSIELTNYNMEFSQLNVFDGESGSILSNHLQPNTKLTFFEGVRGVGIYEKLIPIKWLYAEDFPKTTYGTDTVQVNLRDLFFLLEGYKAPELFFRNIPMTAAICILLDSIGFSNYRFIGFTNNDPIIPNFFVGPDQNIAEVLKNIAIATQSAIFFDEYNNLTVYSKEYIFDNREKTYDINVNVDTTWSDGVWLDADGDSIGLPNVEGFVAEDTNVLNDGTISFTSRYIQRSITKVRQTSLLDEERVYGYKPVLLWEAAPTDAEKTINEAVATQEGFVLSAMALNSGVSEELPVVVDNEITNNVLDFGANIYWIARNQGYLYANGEIIKYDAVEYAVTGQTDTVWIKNNREYQYYFANLPFNGLIYPTGNVRIYADPFYESINDVVQPKNGPVRQHGRGQFGTPIIAHSSGIPTEWTSTDNLVGVITDSSNIFSWVTGTTANTYNGLPATSTVYKGLPVGISEDTAIYRGGTKAMYVAAGVANGDMYAGVANDVNVSSASGAGNVVTGDGSPSYGIAISSNIASDKTQIAKRSKRTELIKNFMSTKPFNESNSIEIGANGIDQKQSIYGTSPVNSSALKASALVFTGPQQFDGVQAKNFITYVTKSLTTGLFEYFGTRMRIIGEISNSNPNLKVPIGNMQMFAVTPESADETTIISGGSGGIGFMLNDEAGYFLEIMSLTNDVTKEFLDFTGASEDFKLQNVVLWKKSNGSAAVTKLWGGITNILVDTGTFVGQDRAVKDQTPTVYDLGVEYRDSAGIRYFNVYINNKLVASDIKDVSPLTITPAIGLFVRGSSKCMFENVFAVGHNPATATQTNDKTLGQYVRSDLNPDSLSDVFRKFSLNQFVTDTYLSNLNAQALPKYNLFYEEFGTIMRECFYFKIRFDNTYPALTARVAPTFNKERRYSVAGFRASPYGAEFLVFNNTDKALVLDETTGSFLRISGIGFTQNTSYEFTVDEYFKRVSNFNDEKVIDRNIYADNPEKIEASYRDIKSSRNKYGLKGFSLQSDYIQTWSQAEELMAWIMEKKFEQKESYSIDAFGVPHLQLGDIVSIHYVIDGVNMIDKDKNFVIVNIDHSRSGTGMSTKLRVIEQ